jgi:hypothetical protein
MMAMMNFATLLISTLLATGIAVLLDWMMLRVAFQWMQPTPPPSRKPAAPPVQLASGTAQLVRAYSLHR